MNCDEKLENFQAYLGLNCLIRMSKAMFERRVPKDLSIRFYVLNSPIGTDEKRVQWNRFVKVFGEQTQLELKEVEDPAAADDVRGREAPFGLRRSRRGPHGARRGALRSGLGEARPRLFRLSAGLKG